MSFRDTMAAMRFLALFPAVASLFAQSAALTPKESSEGWILLFDGESLFGWTQEGSAKWSAANGVLGLDAGQQGWLRHNSEFADFILKIEFRTGKGGNSGIFLRSAKEGQPHVTGYELQIWEKNEKFPTGSLVNHIPAKGARMKPDQWQTYEVTVEGERFVVKLDGRKVLDGTDSKSKVGHIGLQANKDKIEYRNIKLKPLGLKSMFDGKTLAGWREVKSTRPVKAPPEWSVKSGTLHVEKGPGQLETEGTYDDFVFQMEIRTNTQDPKLHPNSGVFFRGDPNGYWTGYESQIRNEWKGDDRSQPVDFGTGAIYSRQPTRKVVANDNEFFTKTIVARGQHLSVWVNGYPVTDWEDTRPESPNARQGARLAAGPISLQAHDPTTNLDFKHIRIGALPKR